MDMLSFIVHYWIEILFSVIVTILTHLYRKISKYIRKIDKLENEACANLKIHIKEKYTEIKKKEYIFEKWVRKKIRIKTCKIKKCMLK